MNRFFIPNLTPGEVSLSVAEAHHASHVLRVRVGEAVEVFDGHGRSADAEIAAIERHDVILRVGELRMTPMARPIVHVAFSVPKGRRLDWLLEKATELGAASLIPVMCHRSVALGDELTAGKRRRWSNHLVAAAKQCGLNHLPFIADPVTLEHLAASGRGHVRLFGDLDESAQSVLEALRSAAPDQEILVFVGPEGGLTDEEREAMLAGGWTPVRLGESTLRVETAAICLLAVAKAT